MAGVRFLGRQVEWTRSSAFNWASVWGTTSLLSGHGNPSGMSRFVDDSDGQSVQDTVSVAKTTVQARAVVKATQSAKADRCLRQVIVSAIEDVISASGATATSLGDVAVTMLPFSDPGNEAQAFRIDTPIKGVSASTHVYVDLYYIQQGRIVATIALTGTGDPVPAQFEHHLTSRLLLRLRRFS